MRAGPGVAGPVRSVCCRSCVKGEVQMLRVSCAFAAVLVCVLVSSASAQTIYMPVQVQHGTDMKYYYGGSNPDMLDYADRVACRNGYPSARTGSTYSSLYLSLIHISEPTRLLS